MKSEERSVQAFTNVDWVGSLKDKRLTTRYYLCVGQFSDVEEQKTNNGG